MNWWSVLENFKCSAFKHPDTRCIDIGLSLTQYNLCTKRGGYLRCIQYFLFTIYVHWKNYPIFILNALHCLIWFKMLLLYSCHFIYKIFTKCWQYHDKQEAHGPQHSPEQQFLYLFRKKYSTLSMQCNWPIR